MTTCSVCHRPFPSREKHIALAITTPVKEQSGPNREGAGIDLIAPYTPGVTYYVCYSCFLSSLGVIP